jgi:isopenicillin-N epimerase
MMTPKGCSFLYVKKELQHLFDPLIISWGYESASPSTSQFLDYHQMNGTRDFSAFLTVPRAIEFMKENNWEQVSADCRQLAQSNYKRFCDLLGSVPNCSIDENFLGQMCSIRINSNQPEKLQRHLFEKYKIEIPVMRHDNYIFIRYSINAFNSQSDLDKLYDALSQIISTGELLQKM